MANFMDIIYFLIISSPLSSASTASYGSYTADWSDFKLCRGPKVRNVTDVSASFGKSHNGSYILYVNLTCLTDLIIQEVRVPTYNLNDKKKIILWNLKIKDPCKHYLLGEAIRQNFNTAHNCLIKKGKYYLQLNITNLGSRFLGFTYYYGDFIFHPIVLSKDGNILCFQYTMSIKKKQ